MDNKQKDIIIIKGSKPIWSIAAASLCFTGALAMIYTMLFNDEVEDIDAALFGIILVLIGVGFSTVTTIHFDLAKRWYKKEIAVGKISFGKWHHLPNIEYVSVFKQETTSDDGRHPPRRTDRYDVNVWYGVSKHFTIYSSVEMQPAYDMAYRIALRLNVDMLDATIKNNSVWVRMDKEI
jgi:hypothetical protein